MFQCALYKYIGCIGDINHSTSCIQLIVNIGSGKSAPWNPSPFFCVFLSKRSSSHELRAIIVPWIGLSYFHSRCDKQMLISQRSHCEGHDSVQSNSRLYCS